MRILLAHNQYRVRGGEDMVVEREAALLAKAGIESFTFLKYSRDIQSARRVLKAAWELPYSKSSARELRAVIRDFSPSIVHAHNTFPLLTPSIFAACEEAGVPVVNTLHNYRLFCANGLMLRGGKNCMLCLERDSAVPAVRYGCYGNPLATIPIARMISQRNEWIPRVNSFIAITQFAKTQFLRAGIPESKLFVKPNFSPDLSARFRHEDQGYALYAGRLSPEKGIATLIQAWAGKKIPLKFCGYGPLASMVRDAGYEVIESSDPNGVAATMAGARMLVMPSECFEGAVPLVILEAISLGLPVIMSRFGAAGEYFRHRENALIFEPGNMADLSSAVDELWPDNALRKAIGANGQRTYLKEFHPERNISLLKEIYERTLAKAGKLA